MKHLTSKILVGSMTAALLISGCGNGSAANAVPTALPEAAAKLAEQISVDSPAIVAGKVTEDLANITPNSGLWNNATFTNVTLYPQTTIEFNDQHANEVNKDNGAKVAKVAALTNGKEIALAVIWKDVTEDYHNGKCTDSYADGVAIQIAKDVSNPEKLPYIGMGSEGREVVIYLQKGQFNSFEPNGNGDVFHQISRNQTNFYDDKISKKKNEETTLADFDAKVASLASHDYERAYVSAGFRSMTEIKDGSSKSSMHLARIKGYGWIATLTRPLADVYADISKNGALAFAVWDGGKDNRNGTKLLSGWTALTVSEENSALNKAVTEVVEGNVQNGNEQVVINCGSCHKFPGASAPDYMAPDLSNIGGYSTAAYLRESIVDPSAVVVPGYNVNAHKNTPWYMLNEGKRESTMPAFDYLESQEINDMIAYLQTLKAKAE